MRRTSAAIAVLTLASAALVAQAPAAHAAVAQSFDAQSAAGSAPHNGSAHVWGTVTWYDRTRVVITGRINDRCPADGYGAYLDVFVEYMNGDGYAMPEAASDSGGCDDPDGVAFSPVSHNTANRNIRFIRLCATEYDMPFRLLGDRGCVTKDNPYT
jgi:hypothetical protein